MIDPFLWIRSAFVHALARIPAGKVSNYRAVSEDGSGDDADEHSGSSTGRPTPRGRSLSFVFQQRSGAKRAGAETANAQR